MTFVNTYLPFLELFQIIMAEEKEHLSEIEKIRLRNIAEKEKSQKIMNTRKTLDSHKDIKKDKNCEICKIASEDLTGHLMTHMKPCSVLILKVDMNKKV